MPSIALVSALFAALLPAERPTALPSLAVLDEHDARRDLRDFAGEPALLLPVFTRCTGTCPMTAAYLSRAQPPFRVIVLSFDPADTAADLRDFRERFALPAEWTLVRSPDAAATRAFLDTLDFHFMKSGEGFDHPNMTFVFSAAGRWAATLTGAQFDAAELRAARDRATARAWRNLLVRPEAWIVLACAGLALAVAAVLRGARSARISQ